jgi:hypothetical protein
VVKLGRKKIIHGKLGKSRHLNYNLGESASARADFQPSFLPDGWVIPQSAANLPVMSRAQARAMVRRGRVRRAYTSRHEKEIFSMSTAPFVRPGDAKVLIGSEVLATSLFSFNNGGSPIARYRFRDLSGVLGGTFVVDRKSVV